MSLYKDWMAIAYDEKGGLVDETWDKYLPLEQAVYEKMLAGKDPAINGTIAQLAERFSMPSQFVAGFLDGISAALDIPPTLEELAEGTMIDVKVDFATLYKKMVEYKAEHLQDLPEWENVFTADQRKKLYREQKSSTTVVVGEKTGRNDPCPCGSGKKYKKCCA
ncbi:MAG: SEC-C metal-binding domain-containing protein [Defluviitaleaceae bacterium]|nr:SEC-C metal-binding domain-containing protein [Defluviitaleaceae bacterium]